MTPSPLGNCIITEHARLEMRRRGLDEELVRGVLAAPQQRFEVRPGRVVLQSKVAMGRVARTYLVRVFADVDKQPVEVVTVYRTTKIAKYWRVKA